MAEVLDCMGGSHVPILAAAVARTQGPVLECGVGKWSTFLLHGLCKGRLLVSLDTDAGWLKRFEGLASETHSFRVVPPTVEGVMEVAAERAMVGDLH